MGIFSFLFGKKTDKKKSKNLTEHEYNLLLWIDGKLIDYNYRSRWKDKPIDVDKTIQMFINKGFIKNALKEDYINKLYTIPMLKKLLDVKNIKVKGKKANLVNSLVENSTDNEINKIIGGNKIYRLTQKGRNFLGVFSEDLKSVQEVLEDNEYNKFLEFIMNNPIATVIDNLPKVEQFGISTDGTTGTKKISPGSRTKLEIELILQSDFSDCNANVDQQRKISATLAWGHLYGKSLNNIARRVDSIISKDFSCEDLFNFCKNNSTHMTRIVHDKINDNKAISTYELATVYIHTKLFICTNKATLEELSSLRIGRGMEILLDKECDICAQIKKRVYSWQEIDEMPILPLHWGCRCIYISDIG